MFTITRVDAPPRRLEPVRLPLTSLTIVHRDVRVFNVAAAVYDLMGGAGWERAARVIRPRIYAPQWSDAQLHGFVLQERELPIEAVAPMRETEFPPQGNCEIVYCAGTFLPLATVLEELVPRNTRLLIFQTEASDAYDAAFQIVRAGGPATIVVNGGTRSRLNVYYKQLYANIVHNYALSDVVRSLDYEGAPDVHAFIGQGADRALQFTDWLEEINVLIDRVHRAQDAALADMTHDDVEKLHAQDRGRLQAKIRKRLDVPDLDSLVQLRDAINFSQESRGVLPLNEIAASVPVLEEAVRNFEEAVGRYPDLAREIADDARNMAQSAPRVLNANFADPQLKLVADPWHALKADTLYELLVDVGPRWSRIRSLVSGNHAFPEAALPPGEDGWRVRVVFYSDDFLAIDAKEIHEPVATADLWVPARSGRSSPMIHGERAKTPGPVALAMRTPALAGRARGRLSLYYENNLLQSALVDVAVGNGWTNKVEVDYVLSGDFLELGRHASRSLHDRDFCVAVNIAMNGDGNGAHRLMIEGHDDLTVSRPYDPKASEKILQIARTKLKECFSQHDAACRVPDAEKDRTPALDQDNGKSLHELKCDLFQLAWYGSDLFTHAFGQLSSPNLIQYLQRLRTALKSRTVIQVARTSHAQYVYPWAMIYDIPLPNRGIAGKLKRCKVVDEEWGSDGRRNAPIADRCPYDDQPEHQQDMLCPYGFWGLKHYIEQPINVVSTQQPLSAASTVRLGNPVTFGLGVTRDASLDAATLQKHIDAIRALATCTPNDGADDWDDVQLMLEHPDVAYFLCHGEYDAGRDAPYLGVGPRGNDARHRVYPSELMQWATTRKNFWVGRRPLIVINGCHTANLAPGEVLSFVTTFANFGASAVIGTEISIRLPLAAEVGEKLLSRILGGEAVGAVMHSLRWELANKGNLLGLAYTPYCLSDLRFA